MGLWRNPVLAREMRLTSANWRVSLMLMLTAGLLGGVVLLFVAAAAAGQAAGSLPTPTGGRLFSLLALLHLALVVLVAPGLTAGALSSERERRTLEPLWQTGLSPAALVWGKLGAALAYLLLLLLASAPSMAALFLLGGIALRQVVLAYAVCLATGLLLAALGLCASALSSRTQGAAAVAYVGALLLLLGTALPVALAGDALSSWGVKPAAFIAAASLNPAVALAATTGGPVLQPVMSAALGPALQGGRAPATPATDATATGLSGTTGLSTTPAPQAPGLTTAAVAAGPMLTVTYRFLVFAAAAALLLILLAALAVRPPRGRGLRAFFGLSQRHAAVKGGEAGG